MRDLDRRLAIHGADLSRWPGDTGEAREALLAQPDFRRAWESERDLDRGLDAERARLDAEILQAGAAARVAAALMRRNSPVPLAGLPWRRIAAGVLVAVMIGGAFDLLLPAPSSEPVEIALVDPLAGLDGR